MDLQRLRQIAKAATPGRWQWWTSNSFMRLSVQSGVDGGVLSGARLSDGQCTVLVSNEDAAYIEAFDPKTVLVLIYEIERLSAPADTITAKAIERRSDWTGTQDAMARGYVKIEATEPSDDGRAAAEAEYAHIYTGGGGGGRSMFVRGWQAHAALKADAEKGSPAMNANVKVGDGNGAEPAKEVPCLSAVRHCIHNLKLFRAGEWSFPDEAIGMLERYIEATALKADSEKDADRYRFMRNNARGGLYDPLYWNKAELWDALIDAAMTQSPASDSKGGGVE